jgi:hypothetical protein
MKLAVISVALLMLATVPAAEARTVTHHQTVSSAHVAKVSDSTKKKAGKHHKAKKAKHTS